MNDQIWIDKYYKIDGDMIVPEINGGCLSRDVHLQVKDGSNLWKNVGSVKSGQFCRIAVYTPGPKVGYPQYIPAGTILMDGKPTEIYVRAVK